MIGYYNYSVIATYISLLCSVVGMSFSLTGNMPIALFFLMLCGLLDMIDGPIARRCKRTDDEKSFGIQIDSLCDMVCFGAQPALFCMKMAGVSWYAAIIAGLFTLAGLIMLGYFNVQELNRVKVETGRIYLVGMAVIGFFYIAPVRIPKLRMRGMILLVLFGLAMYTLVIIYAKALMAA